MFCYVLRATRYHAGSLFSQKMPWHISQHPQRALQQTAGRYWEQTPAPAIAPGGRKRYSASCVLDMVLLLRGVAHTRKSSGSRQGGMSSGRKERVQTAALDLDFVRYMAESSFGTPLI